ncbi:signal transducer and transcription activator-like [Contarinia nasturtii]|uniref:signal transducer and transcription activator-like n=1 Tax=Contarinia nasturtii TaxID=265458 RepID=UPI0012D3BF27|nr:signal transducer and transcription activator-like [Contarinia nasturtii]
MSLIGDVEMHTIDEQLHNLSCTIERCDISIQEYRKEIKYVVYTRKLQELKNSPNPPQSGIQISIDSWNESIQKINQYRIMIGKSIENICDSLINIETMVDHQLCKWKRDQLMTCYGDCNTTTKIDPNEKNSNLKKVLDGIQMRYEYLLNSVVNARKLLNVINYTHIDAKITDVLEQENTKINNLMHKMVSNSLILEEQPTQVIKKDVRFAASVRLLLPNFIKMDKDDSTVKVSLLSTSQAQLQHNCAFPLEESSGEVVTQTANFTKDRSNPERVTCKLHNMQISKVERRTGKKTNVNVTDEKFALLFKSKFQIDGTPLNLWTLSLPIVFTVHVIQEPHAYATIFWDNMFFGENRIPFTVSDRVPWQKMEWELSVKFYHLTGCLLSKEHLHHLYEKCCAANLVENDEISWLDFGKTKIYDQFPFWDWFYAILKLTREYLRDAWKNGLIEGFVSKSKAEKMLLDCQPGTFLFRFSDTELGGISVAWVEENDGMLEVKHLAPFINRDFENNDKRPNKENVRKIGDLIKHIKEFIYIYPGIPKDKAFRKHVTTTSTNVKTNGDYVNLKRLFVVPSERPIVSYSNSPNMTSVSSDRFDVPQPVITQRSFDPNQM